MAHGGMALGLVFLSFLPNIRINLEALLFGDILAISETDLAVVWIGGLLGLLVLLKLWRPLLAATVNEELAVVAGAKPELARLLFGLLVAAIIAIAIKIVGILLIVAMLIIPAAAARRFARNPELMAVGAVLIGIASTVAGMYASARFDTPAGPSIVVAALLVFVATRLRRPGGRAG